MKVVNWFLGLTKKTKIIAIILSAVIVVSGAGAAIAVGVMNSPKMVVACSLKEVVKEFCKRDEIKPIYDTLIGGSMDIKLDSIKEEGEECFENSNISGKLYFSENEVMLKNFSVKDNENEIKGDIYVSNDVIYVKEEKILGDAYGLNIFDFADDLSNSIFATDSGSDYALPEEVYDNLMLMLENLQENKNIQKDLEKVIKKVSEDMFKIVLDNAEISSERTNERLNGEKIAVRLVTIEIDGAAMSEIYEEYFNYLADCKHIVDFLDKYNDTFTSLTKMYGEDLDKSFGEMYEEFFEENEDEIEDICEEIEDDFDTIKINLATPKNKAKLLKLEIKSGKNDGFVLDCGAEGIENTDCISIKMGAENEIKYKLKENNDDKFNATLTIKSYNGEEMNLSMLIDRKKESFKTTFEYDEGDYYYSDNVKFTIDGGMVKKGDTTAITIDKMTLIEENYWDEYKTELELSCKIVVDTKDKMPSLDKYKSVADITEEDIEQWLEKGSENFDA